jgi:hypothetical protein
MMRGQADPIPPLKWPAYAQRLFRSRAKGRHPLRVDVYFGQRWPKAPLSALPLPDTGWLPSMGPWLPGMTWIPSIGIHVEEYVPGEFDLRVLEGLACQLHWGGRISEHQGWGLEWWLAAECCRYADEVEMEPGLLLDVAPVPGVERRERSPASCAFSWKLDDPQRRWPPWWSDALSWDYGARNAAWRLRAWDALRRYADARGSGRGSIRGGRRR